MAKKKVISVNTRKKISCPTLGSPKEFRGTVLLTHEDGLKHFLCMYHLTKSERSGKFSSISEVDELVVDKLLILDEMLQFIALLSKLEISKKSIREF